MASSRSDYTALPSTPPPPLTPPKADTVIFDTRHHALSLVNTTAENASFLLNLVLTLVSVFVRGEEMGALINFFVQAGFLFTIHL